MNDKEFKKAFGHTREEFNKLYNQIQWDNEPQDEIVRLSNNKLKYNEPNGEHYVVAGDMGTSVYMFDLANGVKGITREEWKLIKFYCEMDDDSQPSGAWNTYFGSFWYFRCSVA